MSKVPVHIRIHTCQTLENGESQSFESRETGFLYIKENGLYLNYHENGSDGGKGTQTTWKIEPSQVTLNRQGEAGLRALFKTGHDISTQLVTPHGVFPVDIYTFHLEHNLTLSGGYIRIGYKMEIGGVLTRMELELQVHAANDLHLGFQD